MPKQTVCAMAIFALALSTTAAVAANQVINPDFDTDTNGWTPNSADISISRDSAMNVVGGPGSGAGLVTNSMPGFNLGVTQCVPSGVTGGINYDVGAWVFFASGQAGIGDAGLFVWFYDQAGCTGTQSAPLTVAAYLPPPSDSWTLLTATGVAPAGSVSALIYINLYNSGNANAVSAEYDGVRFGPSPTTPVVLQSFEVD
jgi:hypothetical protein